MLTPPEIARSLLAAGESKARLPFGKMLLLAILAGAYIALAGVGATAAAVTVESGSLAKLLSACVFPAGLSMVILAGSELFTGNCLMVMALLERRITPAQLLRNWLTVYLGNAVGGAAVAALAVIALFFPILLFVLCGYEHCIANLYYLPAGAFAAAEYGMETTLTLAGCLKNLAAVTLGNLVGGAALGVGYRFAYLKE